MQVDLTRLGCPPEYRAGANCHFTGNKLVFCCSHVELEYFEVYFLYNNGIFDISRHSISTLKILESQDLSCGFIYRKKQHHFVSVVCFQPMEWFVLVCPTNAQVALL
jgi:hypothetical protein